MQSSLNQSSQSPSVAEAHGTFSCPSRRDGAESLIAQMITSSMCQSRQRGSYHKCWTCTRRNGAERLKPAPYLRLTGGAPGAEAV